MKNKKLIKQRLNKFGKEKEPFLFIISYDFSKFYIEKISNIPKNIKYEFDKKTFTKTSQKMSLIKLPISFNEYEKKFNKLQDEIKKGNSYLLNLTSKTKISTSLSLDKIYDKVDAKFKLRYKNENDNFVCFSPERFVKIDNNTICTYPMKGTIDANINNAQKNILANEKEMAEHTMVVDLLRNDLSMISKDVKVEKFRYIDKINAGDKKLLQVSSKITGQLQANWHEKIGNILVTMLPAGSITGTPKKSTIDILEKTENYKRDYYTGIFGIFDGKSLDSSVMIRFIEEENKQKYYKSGGGITCDSLAKDEYQELIDKIYLPL
ncbi:MAG: aminodeoxychorismate synthase component I [Campylobacterota bacterium]